MSFWQNTVNIGISDARNEILFPYTQSIEVLVRGNSGNIQITTTNSEQIAVKLHINGVNAAQQLANTQIQFDSTQQLLEVILGDSQLEMHTSIELSICAPAFTAIHTSSTTGNITLNAPDCTTIHTNTMAGKITINAPECTAIYTSTTTGTLTINAPVAAITHHTPVALSTTPVALPLPSARRPLPSARRPLPSARRPLPSALLPIRLVKSHYSPISNRLSRASAHLPRVYLQP
ncbi:MAG: hypothetical protein NT020_10660 [Chloroflexales bacterium]|nr:hypothetical protein [Chloroflexales bacterium]